MNTPLFLAGLLALFAAAAHGVVGELWVVRKLFQGDLASTRFGGVGMTKAMVHATWHITTVAFLAAGAGMVVSAVALDGEAAQATAISSAAALTGFAAVTAALGAAQGSPRALLRHPGPLVLSGAAALAWWGAF